MSLFEVFKNIKYILSLISKATPLYIVSVIVTSVINSLITVMISVYLVMQVFDALEQKMFSNIIYSVILMAILQLFNQIIQSFYQSRIIPVQKIKLSYKLHSKLFLKACQMDYKNYNSPQFYNNFILSLNEIDNRANNVLNELGQLISRITSVITISTILFQIEPFLIICTFLIVFLSTLFERKMNKTNFDRNISMSPFIRENDYIVRTFYLKKYSKELRLNNISKLLFEKFDQTTEKMKKNILLFNKKIVYLNIFKLIISSSLFDMGVMLLFAFRMMVLGSFTLGDYASGINAIWQLRGNLSGIMNSYSSFQDNSQYIKQLREFLNLKPEIISLEEKTISSTRSKEICFKNISFRYNNDEAMVLKNISFSIKEGEKVAIVGPNGAGKTTLIKLLLRLYDPTFGCIELDNTNIKKYNLKKLRNGFGVVFQDYNLYAATLAENIFMNEKVDNDKVEPLLLKIGFFKKNIDCNSIITREFSDEGKVLSEGEAQKIALSRTFAQSFHTYIFDEPSSFLDPIAESHFNKVLRDSFGGKTVIFISHRLTTTHIADRIIYLEDGEVVEMGTHKELMKKKGKYSKMFTMQAEKYVNDF